MRGTLYRISNLVRQYDQAQRALAELVNVEYRGLPAELLESFSHDPAHVLGHTRRLQGYAAVDDIDQRVMRQRKVFADFLANNNGDGEMIIGHADSLEAPIQNILVALERLEQAKVGISRKVQLVNGSLQKVQKAQGVVKEEYYDTVGYTSVAYPEVRVHPLPFS